MLPQPLRSEYQVRGGQRRAGVHLFTRLLWFTVFRLPTRMRVRLRLQPVTNVPTVQMHIGLQRRDVRVHGHLRRSQPPSYVLVPEGKPHV